MPEQNVHQESDLKADGVTVMRRDYRSNDLTTPDPADPRRAGEWHKMCPEIALLRQARMKRSTSGSIDGGFSIITEHDNAGHFFVGPGVT